MAIKLKRGLAATWTADNPVLETGQPGFEKDTRKLKIGDGTTAWNSLPYTVGPVTNEYSTTVEGGEYYKVADFADVDEMISTIGASPLPLLLEADVSAPSGVKSFPSTFKVVPGGGKFVNTGSAKFRFSSNPFTATPNYQVFDDSVEADDIEFLGTRPTLTPEMFGGDGNYTNSNSTAFKKCLDVLAAQNLAGRSGGVIELGAGVYKFDTTLSDGTVYRNITIKGQGLKPMAFAQPGPTMLVYTGTGDRGFDFRAGTALRFEGLAFMYSSTSFTGTLVDVSPNATPTYGKECEFERCYFGGLWTPATNGNVPMGAAYLLYMSGQIEPSVKRCAFIGGVNGIKLQPGLTAGGTDTNVVTIHYNTFNLLTGAGILNPYQQCSIRYNNFECLNFGLGYGNKPTPNGAMPYCIDYDDGYPPNAVWYAVDISQNWFGDRPGSGGAYVRAGRMIGGSISNNFFGGGLNGYENFGATAGGTDTGTTLTLAGANLTTADIGKRVWVHSENWTGVITARLSATTATVDTPFTSSFSGEAALVANYGVREYKGNVSGTSGATLVTVSGVTLPGDMWGRPVWIDGTYVGLAADRTPGTTTFNVDTPLPTNYSGDDMQIGEWRYNTASIQVQNGSAFECNANAFGHGAHCVNVGEDILFEINDLSVTNGSPTVTITSPRFSACELEGKAFQVAGGIPAEGWSVPGGTVISAVGGQDCGGGDTAGMTRNSMTITLSNNVTVTSGQNPRRAIVRNVSAGGTAISASGNRFTSGGTASAVVNPFTNEKEQALYSRKVGGRYSLRGNRNQNDLGISHDYTTFNQGFFSEDFGDGDGVLSIGNAVTPPSSNPTDGFLLYSQSGLPKVRTAGGTIGSLAVDPYTIGVFWDQLASHTDDYSLQNHLPKGVRMTSTSGTNELRGIKPHAGITVPVGTVVELLNIGSNDFIVKNNAGSSSAGYRIYTSTGSDLTIEAKKKVQFHYLPEEGGWYAYKVG